MTPANSRTVAGPQQDPNQRRNPRTPAMYDQRPAAHSHWCLCRPPRPVTHNTYALACSQCCKRTAALAMLHGCAGTAATQCCTVREVALRRTALALPLLHSSCTRNTALALLHSHYCTRLALLHSHCCNRTALALLHSRCCTRPYVYCCNATGQQTHTDTDTHTHTHTPWVH